MYGGDCVGFFEMLGLSDKTCTEMLNDREFQDYINKRLKQLPKLESGFKKNFFVGNPQKAQLEKSLIALYGYADDLLQEFDKALRKHNKRQKHLKEASKIARDIYREIAHQKDTERYLKNNSHADPVKLSQELMDAFQSLYQNPGYAFQKPDKQTKDFTGEAFNALNYWLVMMTRATPLQDKKEKERMAA